VVVSVATLLSIHGVSNTEGGNEKFAEALAFDEARDVLGNGATVLRSALEGDFIVDHEREEVTHEDRHDVSRDHV